MTDNQGPDSPGPVTPDHENAAASPEAAPEMVPAEQVKAALEAAADFKDKMLRALAEMENLRRRTEREVADARAYGISSFARDILGVADNMRRALEAGGTELRASGDPHVVALLDGVELTERELLKALEKNGVKRIEPLGEKFDPNIHQAMYEVPDPSVPSGTVAQVVQAGYLIGDRVLRPALVAVTKGGAPKAADASQPGDKAPSEP
ncbi:MAG TPA: nucleotide exchange factor GrpE [Pseudorhodoplanes sp.]|jgi:molecular chaperone GrpE|nr:nucleotide exchange factor GrpE [Pseudorhodoplanes sp.]